jgi:hypothetical protein
MPTIEDILGNVYQESELMFVYFIQQRPDVTEWLLDRPHMDKTMNNVSEVTFYDKPTAMEFKLRFI